jgi:hypothetical protein
MVAVVTGLKRRGKNFLKILGSKLGFNITNPPHIVKQSIIQKYQQKSKARVLIETGTYLGDMIYAQLSHFDLIYSVELSNELFERAKKRFINEAKVKLFQGDSGEVLDSIVTKLDQPAIFWLDGHYSGGITAKANKDCPVVEELTAILKSSHKHVILIDDARLFTGENSYPTLDEIRNLFNKHGKKCSIKIEHDVIVVENVA